MKSIRLMSQKLSVTGKFLFLGIVLISLAAKTKAQCVSNFTTSIDTTNNGNVTFTNTSTSSSTLFYHWDFGDGTTDTAMNPPTHNYPAGGNFTVCLLIEDSLGLIDSTGMLGGCYNNYCNSFFVTNATAGCNASFYMGDTLTASNFQFYNSSTGGITNYYWDFGDGDTSTAFYPTHAYATAGTYIVCLTASNPLSLCNSTYCDTITVSACAANFTYVADAIGNGVNFTGSSTGPATYTWDFGDGYVSTIWNPYHVYASNGNYYVCLTTSSTIDTTCSNTHCESINLAGICQASFIAYSDTTSIYNLYIYNNSISFGPTSYFWDFGDGTTSLLQYPVHAYPSSGPYNLCLSIYDTLTSCSTSFCDTITSGLAMSSPLTINVVPYGAGVHEIAAITSHLENYPNPFSESTNINYSISKNASVSLSVVDLLGRTIVDLDSGKKNAGSYSSHWNASDIAEGMYILLLKVDNTITTRKIILSK